MKIELLLEKVKNFRSREAERKKYTGEDFNIFEILGIGHLEAATHSKFLGNLLNPQGSHSQGTLFLELFLGELGITTLNINNAKIELEKSIGKQGRLDIYITDSENTSIVIENKIYAGLQYRQLERYCEFLESEKTKNKHLLFLTLSPYDEDNKKSIAECIGEWAQIVKFKHISYQYEMLSWLEKCREKAVQLPLIRESLTQYIQTIKIRNNMNTTNNMIVELFNLSKEDSSLYDTLSDIFSAYTDLRLLMFKNFCKEIGTRLLDFNPEVDNDGLSIKTKKMTDNGINWFSITQSNSEQWMGFNSRKDLSGILQQKDKNFVYSNPWTYCHLKDDAKNGICKFYLECIKNPSKYDSFVSEIKELIKLVETSDL